MRRVRITKENEPHFTKEKSPRSKTSKSSKKSPRGSPGRPKVCPTESYDHTGQGSLMTLQREPSREQSPRSLLLPIDFSKSPSRSRIKLNVSPTESYDLPGQGSTDQFLKPPSYPNQGMVFDKRSVKEKEKSPRNKTSKSKKSPSRSRCKLKFSPTESYDLPGQGSMDQFLKPPSYPNQGMVFDKRSVKEKEKSPRNKTSKSKKSPSRSRCKLKISPTESYDLPGQGSMDQFLEPPSYPNQGMVFDKRSVKEKEKSPRNKTSKSKKSPSRSRCKLQFSPTESMDQYLTDLVANMVAQENEGPGDAVDPVPSGNPLTLEEILFGEQDEEDEDPTSKLSPIDFSKSPNRSRGKLEVSPTESYDIFGPPSYPNPGMVFVEGSVKEKEELRWEVRAQTDLVASMLADVHLDTSSSEDESEHSLVLDRLGELYASLESRPPETSKADSPRGLKTELMGHQSQALAWLKWRETQRPRGGILADDMGFGKTLIMISLMCCDKESKDEDQADDDEASGCGGKGARGGTLVVCPASLLQQWAEEVTKHCKPSTLSVTLHHGASRATQPDELTSTDLVVTTYNIVQRDCQKNGVLMKIPWHRVILDEAHIIRNYKAATSIAVNRLEAVRRWAMTGTPVHNTDLDLFALVQFLRCRPFSDLNVWKKMIDKNSPGGPERLNMILSCILLRRTKLQLQAIGQLDCLPNRRFQEIEVKLTTQEMNVYQKFLALSMTLVAKSSHEHKHEDEQQEMGEFNVHEAIEQMHRKLLAPQGAKAQSHHHLALVLRLRQICCHCGLVASMLYEGGLLDELNKLSIDDVPDKNKKRFQRKDRADGAGSSRDEPRTVRQESRMMREESRTVRQESRMMREAIRSVLSPDDPVFNLKNMSSKIRAVLECLQVNVFRHPGEKAVVVSQWTSVLGLVEDQLKMARIKCVSVTGAVAIAARAHAVNTINDPDSSVKVMLLSLCAGGVGLNLCGANHLLMLDPHWNPQLERQAQDRIYRVGQKKDVTIYKFICVETVEQSIRKLQEAKLDLADNILDSTNNF